jgi:hypothetical protein
MTKQPAILTLEQEIPWLDTASGTVFDPVIHATATLALPKEGLRAPGAAPCVGELYLADISVPPSLYAEPSLGLDVGPIFAAGDILRLDDPSTSSDIIQIIDAGCEPGSTGRPLNHRMLNFWETPVDYLTDPDPVGQSPTGADCYDGRAGGHHD